MVCQFVSERQLSREGNRDGGRSENLGGRGVSGINSRFFIRSTEFDSHKDHYLSTNFSEKATKFEKIFYSVTSNFKWKIFSNFVAFSEYPNFTVCGFREERL